MNLSKLFEMQAALDTHILHTHKELAGERLVERKILALLVELGELANEWRGFKFWSNDQEPRVSKEIKPIRIDLVDGIKKVVDEGEYTNPLLEEYVDCLHFALSIGLEIGIDVNTEFEINTVFDEGPIIAFNEGFWAASYFYAYIHSRTEQENIRLYKELVRSILTLGYVLGFTEEQIEQAYLEKNQVNHQRQLSGY